MSEIIETKLSVNLNKVALLRNQRHVGYPSVVDSGRTILAAGAHGLTIHPRPDERHIRRTDVYELADMLEKEGHRTRGIEFNIEGNPFDDFMKLCEDTRPDQATLVPDDPTQSTSDHGWDVEKDLEKLKPLVKNLQAMGCRVSLFMDPDASLMPLVKETGADRIELYTGPYSDAFDTGDYAKTLKDYAEAAKAAHDLGLGINAGHDLTTFNLPEFKSALPMLAEVSIGHAFIADALWLGFEDTVKAYLKSLSYKEKAPIAIAGYKEQPSKVA
ncbi:pyridoxine 5'-phosphate synthase [Curvivirga sp.]|uniref:pyridoxine 5'-phosphate synthase n=1 Tax=Curvivirga sp. TaxID=2856848 RepID=UPI003B597C80